MSLQDLYRSCRDNDTSAIDLLLKQNVIPDIYLLNEMIIHNHKNVIDMFLKYPLIYNINTLNSCVISENDHMFFNVIKTVNPDHSTLLEVLTKGNMKYLDALLKKNVNPCIEDVEVLIRSSHVSLEFFIEVFKSCSYSSNKKNNITLLDEEYMNCNQDIISFLRQNGFSIQVISDQKNN